jgi:peptide/nickel transport system permease protein
MAVSGKEFHAFSSPERLEAATAGRRISRRRRWWSTWEGVIGAVGLTVTLGIALVGPAVTPHSPISPIGVPFASPGHGALLGTDVIGRDVLSRVLAGGYRLIIITISATAVSYLLGVSAGLVSGVFGRTVDSVIMRTVDVFLAFPAILLLLLLAAEVGSGLVTVVVGLIVVNSPGVARVIRSATLELVGRGFVEAGFLRGERAPGIMLYELLPNMVGTIVADAGPRLSGSLILVAGLNYLGIGVNPPTPDWGAMIFENQPGLAAQPWAVLAPALVIIVLAVSLNLVGDAWARTLGRSGVR